MTPDDWQGYCHNLCRLRHGEPNYQEVPDHDRGDLGIESFALDGTAIVYQFYVAEAPDTAGKFSAQQRKITTDLGKLKKNDEKLVKLLGFRVKRWILVVPSYDTKRIVEHATAKAKEIAQLSLACVDASDFSVLVQDDDAFAIQRAALLNAGVAIAPVEAAVVPGEEVEAWAVENASEVEALDEKLNKLIASHPGSEERRTDLRQELLTFHLRGQNYAEQLETRYPELYEQFAKAKATEEQDLDLRSLTTSAPANEHLAAVRLQYQARLETRVPGLDTDDAPMLSWAGVAEWMIRCPLNFSEPAS
jgi:hypothetical protein